MSSCTDPCARDQDPRSGFNLRDLFQTFATFFPNNHPEAKASLCVSHAFGEANADSSEWFYSGRLEGNTSIAILLLAGICKLEHPFTHREGAQTV